MIFSRRLPLVGLCAHLLCSSYGCTGGFLQTSTTGGEEASSGAGGTTGSGSGTTSAAPYVALQPSSYVPKVKSLLTGQAVTASELSAVQENPNALSGLIDTWMASPAYETVMLKLFGHLFQQSAVSQIDLVDQDNQRSGNGGVSDPLIVQYVAEMFPRTALAVVQQNLPFTSLMSTNTFMMNVPLMVYFGVLEALQCSDSCTDSSAAVDTLAVNNPSMYFILKNSGGVISFADTVNSSSANYMTYYCNNPVINTLPSACATSGAYRVTPQNAITGVSFTENLFHAVDGFDIFSYYMGATNTSCAGPAPTSHWDPSDLSWKMVTIRQPAAGEATSQFWNVPQLRSSSELVLKTPRAGFYTTPSFLGQWNTNVSNQARVTINQTMIVGLGQAFDGLDLTAPVSTAALDPAHAAPGSTCYNCHLTMDPMRQFFRSQYSLYYDLQTDSAQTSMPGVFAHGGVSVQSNDIAMLGKLITQQPTFAAAWAKKVCDWATSSTCDLNDPELLRVAGVFSASNYNWNTLLKTMLSSPLVTYAQKSQSASAHGVVVSIARRDELCLNLSSRLNVADICGLSPDTQLNSTTAAIAAIAQAVPGEDYARGSADLVLVPAPGLIYRTAAENICSLASTLAIDNGATSIALSSDSNAIANLVQNFAGLSASGGADLQAVLQGHYQAAVAQSNDKTASLRSAFVVACMSPYVSGIGY